MPDLNTTYRIVIEVGFGLVGCAEFTGAAILLAVPKLSRRARLAGLALLLSLAARVAQTEFARNLFPDQANYYPHRITLVRASWAALGLTEAAVLAVVIWVVLCPARGSADGR